MSSNFRDTADHNDQPAFSKCAQCGQIKRPFIGDTCSIDCYEKRTGKSWRSYFEPMGKELEQTVAQIRKAFA